MEEAEENHKEGGDSEKRVQFNAKPRQTTAHAQQLTTPNGLYPHAFMWVITGCNNNNNADKYTVDK